TTRRATAQRGCIQFRRSSASPSESGPSSRATTSGPPLIGVYLLNPGRECLRKITVGVHRHVERVQGAGSIQEEEGVVAGCEHSGDEIAEPLVMRIVDDANGAVPPRRAQAARIGAAREDQDAIAAAQ